MKVSTKPFGRAADSDIVLYTLENDSKSAIEVMNYGGIVKSVVTADRDGTCANVALGFDTLDDYLTRNAPYFGAAVGRFANRIKNGRFVLDGMTHQVARNDGSCHLHGGLKGFDKVVWQAEPFEKPDSCGVALRYVSRDHEEGYPGTLTVALTYSLNNDNEFTYQFTAETDRATPVNLTFHGYWNLAGAGSGTILGHELALRCSKYLPVDKDLVPSGVLEDVAGTPMDFTGKHTIGERIEKIDGGYDHCYVVDKSGDSPSPVAEVYEPATGRVMTMLTTEPGVQFYSGNFLDGIKGAGGAAYNRCDGFCLEAQHYPDSVNQPSFPSVILRPGETYHHKTVHRFSTR